MHEPSSWRVRGKPEVIGLISNSCFAR